MGGIHLKVKIAKSAVGPRAKERAAAILFKLKKQAYNRLEYASSRRDDKATLKALQDLDTLGELTPNLRRIKKELQKESSTRPEAATK